MISIINTVDDVGVNIYFRFDFSDTHEVVYKNKQIF